MARLTFLPLDLSGQSLTNRRTGEQHTLIKVGDKVNRVCVLNHGAFYTKSLVVRDNTGRLLSPVTDFKTTYHYDKLSRLTAKEVMGLIIVTNPAVQSPLTVQYQAVGGNFSISVKELSELLDSIKEDNISLKWEDIIGKPTAYVPEDHDHEYWQIYGMGSTVVEIDRIAAAWKVSTAAVNAASKEYSAIYVQKGRDAIDAYRVRVNTHIADANNPHATDKNKVGLSYMNNWTMATVAQVVDRNDATHYLPIGGMYRILSTGPLPNLNAHVTNYNNPHGTTAAMIGCWTKPEIDAGLAYRYLWTDIAANANLYGGRAQATMRNDVILNLNPSDITVGGFPHTQMGGNGGSVGLDTWNWALCGDGNWRRWADLVAPFNANRRKYVSLGNYENVAQLQNIANVVFAAWPDGTIAFGTHVNQPTPDVIYTLLKAFIKSNGAWLPLWG